MSILHRTNRCFYHTKSCLFVIPVLPAVTTIFDFNNQLQPTTTRLGELSSEGAVLALGEPSPGKAHFHLHRFLSLRIRPLLCSCLLRPPPPHSFRYKISGGEKEERSRKRSRKLLSGEEEVERRQYRNGTKRIIP